MPITEDRREKFNGMIDFMDAVDSEIVNYALDFTGTIVSKYCAEIGNLITDAVTKKKDRAAVSNVEMLIKLREFELKEISELEKVLEKAKKRMN